MTAGSDPFQTGWLTALSQAWEAALHGSYPIGACVVDEEGRVLARGRNRLNEPRRAEGGVIGGHDLAHAEINALLDLPHTRRPECLGWTVLTTLEPCPQCAGAVAMSGIRGVQYAAPDPWGGCARLLTDDPYVSRKRMRVERAPEAVGRAALRLTLLGFLEEGHRPEERFLQSFAPHREDLSAAQDLFGSRTWLVLKDRRAPLSDVLREVLGREGEAWARAAEELFPSPAAPVNLSPGLNLVVRACAWIEREDGSVLMTSTAAGNWTLPGGGIESGETAQDAAVREAWEEVGARCEVAGDGWTLENGAGSICVPLRLLALEDSPEGRAVAWINPHSLPWADDEQLRQVLAARGQTPPHLACPPLVARADAAARDLGFGRCCSPEVGRLLRTLAASKPGGHLLELGTGTGAGAAWLHAGMNAAARLLTVENDPARVRVAAEMLASAPQVRVLYGDWSEALAHAPFDLIFADCAPAKRETAHLDRLIDALKPGGMLVLDNFSPLSLLSANLHAGDPERDALFSHPRLQCSEVQVSRRERVILATRTS